MRPLQHPIKKNSYVSRRLIRLLTGMLFAAVLVYGGCKTAQQSPADDVETAQAFIRYCNSNHFEEAATLLDAAGENQALLKAEQERFAAKTSAAMEKARAADIIVHEIQPVSETERIFVYSTSDEPSSQKKLRLVKRGESWKIILSTSS